MNHKKVKKQINKINSFFDSITADEEVSKIEKDLLLSYVRKLYEAIADNEVAQSNKSAKSVANIPSPSTQTAEIKEETVEEVIETPTIIERKPFEKTAMVQETPDVTEVPKPAKAVKEVIQAVTPSNPVAEVIDIPSLELSENMISIFEQASGNEISDRLGNLPIKDLTKSMGINERMFTVKELFGGDQEKFKSVLNDLNGFKNFEEAKSYLIEGVASELNWDESSKYKKALNFVKLVQRRYS